MTKGLALLIFFAFAFSTACSSSLSTGPGGNGSGGDGGSLDPDGGGHALKTVFIILMENHSWSTITGSSSAPFINGTLVKQGAHAENYQTPPGNHPSEPNYIWLEAGDNLGITDDNGVDQNGQTTTDHLVSQLEAKGISWVSYQESISGTDCPLTDQGDYLARHNPMVFFKDTTDNFDPNSAHCKDHVRLVSSLADDLTHNRVGRYNFITPNRCNDMHGKVTANITDDCSVTRTDHLIQKGDDWLRSVVGTIQGSSAYTDGGVIFVTWDEGDEPLIPIGDASDGPIGMIVLSPLARAGYSNQIAYTHSSTLRTIETIFDVPLLRDAQNATALSDLFTQFP